MVDNPNPFGCEGTRVYTYRYTDCAGNNTNWTYTYTIDITTSPIVPANGVATVACVTLAVAPIIPMVTDACGNNLSPVLLGVVDSPNPFVCSGTRIYNYSFTDCAGNISNWSYTYTISAPILNVSCPADQTLDADPSDTYTIPSLIATDNCTGGMVVGYSITGVTTRSGAGSNASGLFNVGVSNIAWTVTDVCGTVYTCNTIVTINFPTVICPVDFDACIDGGLQILSNSGESPLGGVFSGTGVVLNAGIYSFNPAVGVGTYTITYTWHNINNYEASCAFNITVNPKPTSSSIVIQNPLCNGNANGEIEVNVSVGTADFDIDWGVGSATTSTNTYTISGLTDGIYNITVTDANGCSFQTSSTLVDPVVLTATTSVTSDYNGQDVSCNSAADGSAIVNAIGGTTSYSYLWSASAGNQITQEAFNLPAGNHSVVVTDANGCSISVNVIISEPDDIVILLETNSNVSCNGLSDGNVTATATGGTPLYSYLWNDPAGTNTRFATQLPVGTWTVVVTDANSCIANRSVTITEPEILEVEVTAFDVRCFGEANGSAAVSVTGGTPNYTYEWNDYSHSTNPYVSDLPANTYSVVITDDNGCQIIETIVIDQPTALTVSCSTMPVVCGNTLGSAFASVNGGNGGYLYQWSPNGAITAQVGGLITGNYDVLVTDALGCTVQTSAFVGVQGNINVNITEDNPISCFGLNDAMLTAHSNNGINPLTYLWTNSEITASITNIYAGLYGVQVLDAWGCGGNASYNLTQPNQIILSIFSTDVNCFGGNDGTANVIPGGGITPYTYLWSNNMNTSSISNLIAGNYIVTVTDFSNCSMSADVTVSQPLNRLDLSYSMSDVKCFGNSDGFIHSQAIGGVPPYVYLWEYDTYSSNSPNIDNLSAGDYSVYLSDAHNCAFDTVLVISEPAPINASFVSGNPSCIGNHDGFIELSVVGGTGPYLFNWNSGTSPIEYIGGLIQGDYLITVTDFNGCEFELTSVVLVDTEVDCIKIPNAFTPNGDGINDTWIIENIDMFPTAYISVFNRWGQLLYEANGTDNPWDGKYNGKLVPTGTYIYIVNLFDGSESRTGTLTVVY
jgi:gliding motility-associated-like protein